MTKQEIIDSLAKDMGLTKTHAKRVTNHIIDMIQDAVVRGESVTFTGFGTLQRVEKPAREIKLTGFAKKKGKKKNSTVSLPDRYAVKFKSGAKLKQKLVEQHETDKK